MSGIIDINEKLKGVAIVTAAEFELLEKRIANFQIIGEFEVEDELCPLYSGKHFTVFRASNALMCVMMTEQNIGG